jgi:hypothetical protein
MRRIGRAFITLAIIALAVGNAWACRRYCANDASYRSNHPFLTDDHTLHFANALATRNYLRESGTNAGYDPYFMSGYAKSSLWPTNALLEIVMFLTPSLDPAVVYKSFVWLSAATIPIALIYAGWRLRVSRIVVLLAVFFWMSQYWSSVPFHTFQFVQFGMSAFVWSVALLLAAGASLEHWLRTRTIAATLELGVLAGLALMAHPTTAILLGVPAILVILLQGETRGLKALGQTGLAAVIVVAVNYWWIVPLLTLRNTWGGSPAFFNNPNVWERLSDLFRVEESAPLLAAPSLMGVLLFLTLLNGRRFGLLVPMTVIWIFLLAFPAGVLESLSSLQVGRNTLHLNAWICLPAAAAVAAIWSHWRPAIRNVTLVGLGWCLLCGVVPGSRNLSDLFAHDVHATTAVLFPDHAAMLQELCEAAPTARRVLFEVFENRFPEMAGPKSPYGRLRLSPLVPMESGLEAIGGPYLATHYRTNFTNCGEGFFVGAKRWNRKEAIEFFQLYGIDLAVFWSRTALGFAETNTDLFEPVKGFRGIKIFRIRRQKAPWETAGLKLSATYNQIIVENPWRVRGTFVLPFHSTPGWSVGPPCELVSTFQGDDPVPFLTVVDPPEKVTLRFSPWTISGPPPTR